MLTEADVINIIRRTVRSEYDFAFRNTPYLASIYLDNVGSPTHTNENGWQKVGDGGVAGTWASEYDIRFGNALPQVDLVNKCLWVRNSGAYLLHAAVAFDAIGAATDFTGAAIFINGVQQIQDHDEGRIAYKSFSAQHSLEAGDKLELYAYQTDSASETYDVSRPSQNRLAMSWLGPKR